MPAAPSPKDRFTSLDTLAVARELRALGPVRVDKAFDAADGGWSLTLRSAKDGRRELLLVPGRFAALLAGPLDHREELSPFARDLRRLLAGAALKSVAEPRGERYLELTFGRSDDPAPSLVALEMFGTGNLTVAREGRLVAVATARRWAHRLVRVGAPFSRPPERTDPWAVDAAGIAAVLARSRTDLTSTVAARLSFGGPVAEELVARARRDGSEPATRAPDEVAAALAGAIAALRAEIGDRPTGHRVLRGDDLLDATPYHSARWEGVDGVREEGSPTFSEAAYAYFRTLVPTPVSPADAQRAARRRELERQIAQQEAAVAALSAEIDDTKARAETIYAHYPEAEAALAAAEGPPGPTVRAVLGARTVELKRGVSPRESAQALYEEAKRVGQKLAGATEALAQSRAELEIARPPAAVGPAEPAAASRARRPMWFERYRWFVSSERVVAVAGRDASSNDLVVRRHLKDGDVYLHADLHGAASVVVKRPPETGSIGPATLAEAAQWAVCFSKAWRAGLASASAFWVRPDQVSKAAASGEFVSRGAWVIHGTKNVLKDLPLELALGPIDYEGALRWTAAPVASVRALGEVRAVLVPGDERTRAEREVALARELGVPRSLLQSLLPAGGIDVRRA